MQTRRVYRRLVRKKGGSGWQVSWIESPTELPIARVDSFKESATSSCTQYADELTRIANSRKWGPIPGTRTTGCQAP